MPDINRDISIEQVDYNIDIEQANYTIEINPLSTFEIQLNKQGPQGARGEIGPQGPQGIQGIQGERGEKGEQGDIGPANTLAVGSVLKGEDAEVTIEGESPNQTINFVLPKGDKGDQGIEGPQGPQGLRGVSVTGVEEISKVGLVSTYRMYFSDSTHFDYQVTDGSIDGITREEIINILGYEPASYTSVEGLTTRVSTLEQRVEDLTASKFPNVVIIGTPSIEGGQVSGYSNTNYLQFPFVDISRGLPFDIYFSFTTGSDVITQQNLLDSYFGIALAIQNSKAIMALSSNGTSWDIGNVTGTTTILPNTTYYVKCGWTGTQYNASLSTNDTTYVPDMVLNSTLTTNKTTIFIGGSPDLFGAGTAHPFKGTINFNKSRVDVQGVTVWEGMADVGLASRANVSLNNLDNVGEARFDAKQDKLTAGDNITILNNIISATGGSGLELCDIGMALYVDETKGLRRYLNGQIVDINANTQAFLDRLKQITTLHPSLLCTEDEWQTAKTMSVFGQVGKFVFNYSGETVVSVRIPRVVNVQGLFDLQNLGMTVEAGLPIPSHTHTRGSMNITGSFALNGLDAGYSASGSFYGTDTSNGYCGHNRGTKNIPIIIFDASRNWSGSTSQPNDLPSVYGNSSTVQQEAIQYPYFIQIATGSETENNIINDIELNNPYSFGDSKYSPIDLNNLSWLASSGQWNAKGTYPSYYNWILENVNNSVEGFKLSTAEDITDYDWVINTAEETFRLPLLDGSEDLPSGKRVNLELLASGSTYIAPANGWLDLRKGASSGQFIQLQNINNNTEHKIYGSDGGAISTSIKCKKGDSVIVTYNANGTTYAFGWSYAQGNGSLYYYVGETVQNANLINAGRIGEQLANKQDKCIHITETYKNGTSWYRVYSDGWCEQGGVISSNVNGSITFLKSFVNTAYILNYQINANSTNARMFSQFGYNKTTTGFSYNTASIYNTTWYACGYIR